MTIDIDLEGNLTTITVEVTGYFTQRINGDYWQPPEGGYFEIHKIEKDGKEISTRLSKCKGLLEQIANHIEEYYND